MLHFVVKTMKCPKCKSAQSVKDGMIGGRQRYRCKECVFRYTVEYKAGISPYLRRLALMLYLEGLGFRSIGRILGVSNVAVLKWIRAFGLKAQQWKSGMKRIQVVEMDELHTFVGSKKMSGGYGWLLTGWGKDGYIMYLATEHPIRESSYGKPLKVSAARKA